MSVLIKGMKMPQTCWECFAENSLNVYVVVFGGHCPFGERIVHIEEFDAKTGRHPSCPLVEVPTPHGRLIDGDKAKEDLRRAEALTKAFGYHNVIHTIVEQPTIIEAEEGDHE